MRIIGMIILWVLYGGSLLYFTYDWALIFPNASDAFVAVFVLVSVSIGFSLLVGTLAVLIPNDDKELNKKISKLIDEL